MNLSSWPIYSDEEIEAVSSVLRSGKVNYWTGTECRNFEKEFASYHGVKHAVALGNGTLALELALISLGIGEGDEVIVTPRSFFASASCIAVVGARPIFADVDRCSQNLTASSIKPLISAKTKAILLVHLAGWPCQMDEIIELGKKNNLAIIEDCAQAHSAKVNGRVVGSIGDVAAFSFCQDKIMSTMGEGGMLLTNSTEVWKKAWSYKDHGKNYESVYAKNHPPGFRWLHDSLGSNYRMTEAQATVGRIQLRKLDEWVLRRRYLAKRIADGLADVSGLRIPLPSDAEYHAYYKFYFFVRPEALKSNWSRDRILSEVEARGVPGWSGSCPEIYRESLFKSWNYPVLPVAKELGETSVMLPVHPSLEDFEVDNFVSVFTEVMREAVL